MTRLVPRNAPPRKVWQLEQQGVHPLLARLYAARGVESAAELDYELKALLPPATLPRLVPPPPRRGRERLPPPAAPTEPRIERVLDTAIVTSPDKRDPALIASTGRARNLRPQTCT